MACFAQNSLIIFRGSGVRYKLLRIFVDEANFFIQAECVSFFQFGRGVLFVSGRRREFISSLHRRTIPKTKGSCSGTFGQVIIVVGNSAVVLLGPVKSFPPSEGKDPLIVRGVQRVIEGFLCECDHGMVNKFNARIQLCDKLGSVDFHGVPSAKRIVVDILLISVPLHDSYWRLHVDRKAELLDFHVFEVKQINSLACLQLQQLYLRNSHVVRSNEILDHHQKIIGSQSRKALEIGDQLEPAYFNQIFNFLLLLSLQLFYDLPSIPVRVVKLECFFIKLNVDRRTLDFLLANSLFSQPQIYLMFAAVSSFLLISFLTRLDFTILSFSAPSSSSSKDRSFLFFLNVWISYFTLSLSEQSDIGLGLGLGFSYFSSWGYIKSKGNLSGSFSSHFLSILLIYYKSSQ